ncbi:Bifunctional purine biosynthetic protein ADE5,7 [Rhizina undulata]
MASSSSTKPRLVVLISGSGTNLQALIDATQTDALDATITHVVSNKKFAYGLTRAANAGISTSYHNLVPYKKRHSDVQEARREYDADLAELILAQEPDLVVCAGWMHIFSPAALEPLEKKGVDIINLHPALPGQFDGAGAIERAFEAWERGEITKTGIMIHYVIVAVDRGEPIIVREVEMSEGETLESLEEKIHKVEHVEIVNGTRIALERRRERSLKA